MDMDLKSQDWGGVNMNDYLKGVINKVDDGQEIGVSELSFDRDGKLVYGHFNPTMQIKVDNISDFITGIDCKDEDANIINKATQVFATWFQRMNDIELADRSQFEISTQFIEPCERWDNGIVKLAKIRFVFKHI